MRRPCYFLFQCIAVDWQRFAIEPGVGRKRTQGQSVSRILLVEDDADVRLAVEHVLLDEGYEVDAAGNCQQGRAFLDAQPYDLLLTDGRLPDGTGIELADDAAHDGVPALIITGYAFMLRALVPDLSQYRILLKPLRPAEIIEAVAGMLDQAVKN